MTKYILFFTILFITNANIAMNPGDLHYDPRQDDSFLLIEGLDHLSHDRPRYDPLLDLSDYFSFRKQVSGCLKRGTSIDCVDRNGEWSPLSRAAFRGDIWQCKRFLKLGADVNNAQAKYTPLVGALKCERSTKLKVFFLLLEHGADINQMGNSALGSLTPLKMAIENCKYDGGEALNSLFALGADPLLRDLEGRNALMVAAASNYPYWPVITIIKHIMRKKYAQRPQQIAFLCAVNRLRVSDSWREKCLGSTLYLNRSRILQYLDTQPSLADALLLCDSSNKTAYQIVFESFGSSAMKIMNLLDPANARKNELNILKEIRADAAHIRLQRECQFCVVQ